MFQKLIFTEDTTLEQVEFDFSLRGFTLPTPLRWAGFEKYLRGEAVSGAIYSFKSPGKSPLQKEVFLHYSKKKHCFWCWIEKSECEKFLISRNVNYMLSTNLVTNAGTQTD